MNPPRMCGLPAGKGRFDNFAVTVTSLVVQETHYDPWGLELTGLGHQEPGLKVNKYLFNQSSLLLDDFALNCYWTPNRFYDPSIGRFNGIDKVADMFTSVSPMIFGFNNPLKFVDPTGLFGDLPEFTITASRLPSYSMQY